MGEAVAVELGRIKLSIHDNIAARRNLDEQDYQGIVPTPPS